MASVAVSLLKAYRVRPDPSATNLPRPGASATCSQVGPTGGMRSLDGGTSGAATGAAADVGLDEADIDDELS